MAEHFSVSPGSIQRIRREHRLPPHRVESFKFSSDPHFAAKVRDIVLYLRPSVRPRYILC